MSSRGQDRALGRGRDPRRSAPPARRGLLSGMSAPPMDSMPRIRTSFTRGLAGAWSSPLVVGSLLAWLVAEWLVVVALGYPGPFVWLAHVSAPAPLSTFTDLTLSTGTLGVRWGLLLVFAPAAVHAVWFSLLVGLAIETIESGDATRWGAIRGLRAFPVVFALHVIGVAVVFAAQTVGALGGTSLALLVMMAALVAGVWLFAFAPVIAVTEHRRLTDCFGRSVRAARMPGSGNLPFAAIYVVPVFATFLAPGLPGALLGVNPPYSAWIYVVLMNLLHAAIVGAFALRYLAVAEEVPEAPVRTASSRGRPGGKASKGRP
jgi:fumarate reductase subunit C